MSLRCVAVGYSRTCICAPKIQRPSRVVPPCPAAAVVGWRRLASLSRSAHLEDRAGDASPGRVGAIWPEPERRRASGVKTSVAGLGRSSCMVAYFETKKWLSIKLEKCPDAVPQRQQLQCQACFVGRAISSSCGNLFALAPYPISSQSAQRRQTDFPCRRPHRQASACRFQACAQSPSQQQEPFVGDPPRGLSRAHASDGGRSGGGLWLWDSPRKSLSYIPILQVRATVISQSAAQHSLSRRRLFNRLQSRTCHSAPTHQQHP